MTIWDFLQTFLVNEKSRSSKIRQAVLPLLAVRSPEIFGAQTGRSKSMLTVAISRVGLSTKPCSCCKLKVVRSCGTFGVMVGFFMGLCVRQGFLMRTTVIVIDLLFPATPTAWKKKCDRETRFPIPQLTRIVHPRCPRHEGSTSE
jgi:hypothetical protein